MMKKDSAVSPVIGSILLVAITVIITAVIAAFVFGMTGDIQKTKIVAVTSQKLTDGTVPNYADIELTNHGGKDATTLKEGADAFSVTLDGNPVTADGLTNKVGSVGTIGQPHAFQNRQHVVVVAHFIDGTSQVVLDTME